VGEEHEVFGGREGRVRLARDRQVGEVDRVALVGRCGLLFGLAAPARGEVRLPEDVVFRPRRIGLDDPPLLRVRAVVRLTGPAAGGAGDREHGDDDAGRSSPHALNLDSRG
jgi:hypothetical protein